MKKKKDDNRYIRVHPFIAALVMIVMIVLGVSLMFQCLKTVEQGALIQSLQADQNPQQVLGIHKGVDHKQKMKR